MDEVEFFLCEGEAREAAERLQSLQSARATLRSSANRSGPLRSEEGSGGAEGVRW